MSDIRLRVHAGSHTRRACPVSVRLDAGTGIPSTGVMLTDMRGGRAINGQCALADGGMTLTWIVDRLEAGEEREYIAHLGATPTNKAGQGVVVTQAANDQVDVHIAGRLFTSYYYGSHLARPYCYPINDPLGSCVTRGNAGDKAGESTDHPHHRSLWTAYGEVNEKDNWSEGKGHGYTVHRAFDAMAGGPVHGGFTAEGDWTTAEGGVLLHENRTFRFYDAGEAVRVFDMDLTLQSTNGDVHFGDTKEGGFLSVRVVTTMDASGAGRIENSYGAVGEKECWGKRAHWCDYSGPVDDHWSGIAVMEHPDTFRSPTYWHVRDYGLMGTNPFGAATFRGNPQLSGACTLPAGERLRFAYRVVVHTGDATEARIADAYHQYINPPKVAAIE